MYQRRDERSPDRSNQIKSTFIETSDESKLQQEVKKLHQLTLYGRWLVVLLLWISIGSLSLWGLRAEIALWQQHFTWVAVRYGLVYNRFSTLGLAFCISMTSAVLVWQSRNILWGMSNQEQKRLEQQVRRIRQQGASHPLWKWVCQPKGIGGRV